MRAYWTQRSRIGLSSPTWGQRLDLWARLKIPSAKIYNGFTPLPSFAQLHAHPARTKLATGASRVGKSVDAAAGEIVPWSLHSRLVWIVGPKYSLTRSEFRYSLEALLSLKLVSMADVSFPSRDMTARMTTRTGCEIVTKTTHEIEELVSEGPDLVVICEPGLIEEEIINAMRIRLMTRRGMMFIAGTLKRSNPWVGNAYLRWRRWPNAENGYAVNVPLWENLYDFPDGRQDDEIALMERTLPRRQFLEEIVGVPVASEDLVFSGVWKPQLSDGQAWHLRPCPFQPLRHPDQPAREPVVLWVDPGYGPGHVYAVLPVQFSPATDGAPGEEARIIDEFAPTGMAQSEVIRQVKLRRWAHNITEIVVDPWAARSHVFGADSPQEVWQRAFPGVRVRCEVRAAVEDGVQAVADWLMGPDGMSPRLFVDSTRCPRTVYEFEHWRRRKTTGKPEDLNCDALKAMAAGVLHRNLDLHMEGGWNEYDYNTGNLGAAAPMKTAAV